VLELELKELDHLERRPRSAGDGYAAVSISGKDLLDRTVTDVVTACRSPVTGKDNTIGESDGDACGAVRYLS